MTRRYHTIDLHNHTPFVSSDYRDARYATAEQIESLSGFLCPKTSVGPMLTPPSRWEHSR